MQSGEVSLAVFVVAAVTDNAVLDAIADTVLVSELTTISSPIDSSDKNKVFTPGTSALAPGSIEPVSVKVGPSVNLIYKPNSLAILLNFTLSYI